MTKPYILAFFIFALCLAAVFCMPDSANAQANNINCSFHSYQRCNGNYLYWYDSCGNQEFDPQYCPNGCSGNICNYNNDNNNYNNNYNNNDNNNYNSYGYNNYGSCTFHAYQLCQQNNIYWYDSCGKQQDFVQSCTGLNMICKYGQCTYQPPAPAPAYILHYRTSCYANNIYWYDSLGRTTGLYKNCADQNSCTVDACASGRCSNILKCDGTTCAAGSADFSNYCQNSGGSNINVQNNNNVNANGNMNVGRISVSFFIKQDQNSAQWQKTVNAGSNGQVFFMISVANNSGTDSGNVNVSANIPGEIVSLGNLQINGVSVAGDIVSGISIGSLSQGSAKSITFEGKTQSISIPSTKQAIATVSTAGSSQSDSVSLNFASTQALSASVSSSNGSSSGFWEFLKRWYLWILVGLVLLFLFVVVFRRLSATA